MPREIRKVLLSNEELVEAIHSFRRVRDDLLPPGPIQSVTPGENDGISVSIEMTYGPNVRQDNFVLTNAHVIEAMVRYCVENNIVVPRHGKRTARNVNGEWILEFRLKGSEMFLMQNLGAANSAPANQAASRRR